MKTLRSIIMLCCLLMASGIAKAQSSQWTCDERSFEYSMSLYISASLYHNDISDFSNYEIGAFCGEECRGLLSIEKVGDVEYGYLRARSNKMNGESITFKLYDKQNDKIILCDSIVPFVANERIGFPSEPYHLNFGNGYVITVESSNPTYGSVSGGGEFNSGDQVTLLATPNDGYHFEKWSNDVTDNPYVFSATENLTLTAIFQPNIYKLIYKVDNEVYKSLDVDYASVITPEAEPTKEGYTFSGWSEIPETMPSHDVEVIGNFTINQYKVSFVVDGVTVQEEMLDFGSKITAPENPSKTGYSFSGWSPAVDSTVPAHDVTYVAQFSINQYTITFDTDGGSEIAPITQNYNTSITAPANPIKTGYTFAGWDKEIPATMQAENITIKARWAINKYMLTYKIDGEIYHQDSIAFGSAVVLITEPVNEGKTFSGWKGVPEVMPAHDVTIVGSFNANAYTITYKVDDEVYMNILYEFDESIIPEPNPTKDGYTFSGWSVIPETMPSHDVEITGSFCINQYKVTFISDGETIKEETLDFGSAIVAPANPTKVGYTFTGWNPALNATVPAHDVTYVAQFTVNQYTITFDTDGGSEIAPITQDYNSVVTAPANPTKTGYTFAGWDKEIPTLMPAENITIKALWTINQYTITFDTDGGSEIAPITQNFNTAITAPADPTKIGYTFSGWDKEIPTTMPAENITIKALWTINKYILTYKVDGEVYKQYEIEYNVAITPEIAPVKEGYSFSGWDEIPATMPANDVEVTGTLTINKYKVTFIVDGETVKEETLDFGSLTSVPDDPTKIGHTFTGWNPAVDATVPSHDVTYKAKFSVNQYTITFDTDGGSEIAPITQDYNTAVTIPTHPVKTGYTFAGWDREIPSTMPAENITIKALWTINQYKVTFLADGIVISEETLDYGSPVTVPEAPDKEGYTFVNWGEVDEKVPAHDVVYVANYEVNYYKLTYILDDVVYGEFDVAFGETIIPLEVDPVEGRLFEGWQDIPVTMPSHDVKVYGTTVATDISVMATEGLLFDVYTLGGILVKKNVNVATLRSTLDSGIYIINGKKIKL